MKRFAMMVLVALLLVVGGMPLVSYAQGVTVEGTGTLTAEGDGRATLYGGGTVTASAGTGQLWIYDRNGDAEITVTGEGQLRKTVLANGDIRYYYRGFKGNADISGSDVGIILKGLDITMNAEGTGRVHLYGDGTYTVNSESGVWSYQGVHLTLGTRE
jgi:hypothetical protein